MKELHLKYRPQTLKEVVGQPDAVRILSEMVEKNRVPHTILLSGASGCGKTTLARILRAELGCADHDFQEINAAESRGIDTIRSVQSRMNLAPMGGPCRVWLFDEAHQLTKKAGGDAQTAMLKMLEDTPSHVYFFLCTTDPGKLLKTIVNRCTEIKVNPLSSEDMEKLLSRVLKAEGAEVGEKVIKSLIDAADGSARMALNILNKIIGLDEEEDQLNSIAKTSSKRHAIEICRLLMNPKAQWTQMAALLKDIDEEPESIRRMILGYFAKVLLNSTGGRASWLASVINIFRDHYYDCGKAGLYTSCWEALGKK